MKVSVCICTCNRPELLHRLLRSLRHIELGSLEAEDVELVVVDNNPTGEAREICRTVSSDLPVRLHFAEERQRGIPFARNRAVHEALDRGADWIAFIDDDDVPEPDWLLELLRKQQQSAADLVCGVWRWDLGADASNWALDTPMFKQLKVDRRKRGIPPWMATCNVLIGRRTFERLGSRGPVFSPEFGFLGCDDTDFFIRASRDGARVAVAEKSIINRYWQDLRLTLRGMLRHGFRHGNSLVHIAKKHDPPAGLRKTRSKAMKKLSSSILLFPVSVFSKKLRARRLYDASYGLGMLYAFSGRQFDFYR